MRVGVIGAGAWGTALANLLASKGEEVVIWAFEPEVADQINNYKDNRAYLPGAYLDERLRAVSDLAQAVSGAEAVVMVTPSHHVHHVRRVAGQLAPHLDPKALVVTASKGIEAETLQTMTAIMEEVVGDQENRLAVLSGPSFAREVARGLPTAVTAASREEQTAKMVQSLFMTDRFRVYTTTDTMGVELGGALKNVMAIAAGIITGLGLGANTQAALITRGLAEMTRLGVCMGADPLTFSGLAGMGDLVLTCTSSQSRNQTVGHKLGQGMKLKEILAGMTAVAEGVKTSLSAHQLAVSVGVEMPICEQAYRVLHQDADPRSSVGLLMTRDPKLEKWGLDKKN
jgi:glycerol-3-phosphate dehydrogenase (NAD(P)+)